MDSFLSMYFLFQVINFESVWNTTDNISRCKNAHLKQKKHPSHQQLLSVLMYKFTAVKLEIRSHLVTVNTSKLHVRCVGHEEVTIEISCSNTCRCPHPHDGIKCNWATHIMLDICYKSFTIQVSLSKYFACEETSLLLNIHIGINTFCSYTQMIQHHSILYDWQEYLFI